jgi:hypothetical protein
MNEVSKLLVARHFCRQPEMMLPGFEFLGAQNPPNGCGRNVLRDSISFEFTGQLGAIPLRKGTSYLIGPLASNA